MNQFSASVSGPWDLGCLNLERTPRGPTPEDTLESTLRQLRAEDKDLLKELVKLAVREVVEGDMSEVQEPDWASATRAARGYRSGYDERGFVVLLETRIELRLPQDREGRFSAEPFERYQRSEKALVAGMEMYVPGVSTPKVTNATEQLCGASSATA